MKIIRVIWIFLFLSIFSIMYTENSYAELEPNIIAGVWLLDEGQGKVAKDFSGNGNDGTISGAKWVKGKFGNALEFDGVDDYVEISLPDVFSDIPNNDFTITFWANVRDISGSGTIWTRIIEARFDNSNYIQFNIQINDGELGVNMRSNGVENTFMVDSPIVADTWYHVAGVWHAINSSLEFYLDGVLQLAPGTTPAEPGDQKVLNLGRRTDGSPDTHFEGILDDFAVFNVALTESDIKNIMTNGLKIEAPVSFEGKLAVTWATIKRSD